MKTSMERYLDKVMAVADIRDTMRERQIREELADHLEQKAAGLTADGYSETEAVLKALEDHGNPVIVGYRLRPWRFVDVRLRGTARGVIAIGPRAHGVVAIGGFAFGVFAFGGVAIGAFGFGGMTLALLAWGGMAVGAIAYGGLAAGLLAFGGMAVGVIASGGTALGMWVPGAATAVSYFTWETVPAWWRAIGEVLSYNPNSAADREAFGQLFVALSLATAVILFAMLGVQGVLLMKERKRLSGIEPSIME
jgi:hypothetical protein